MSGFILLPQKKFDELNAKVDRLLEFSRSLALNEVKMQDWIPQSVAEKLLGLKETSLWTLRKRGQLVYSKIGSKTFYSLKSIEKLLQKNQQ